MSDEIDNYLSKARNGEFEAAFFGLIDLPNVVVHDLEEAYHGEPDPEIRLLMVEILCQHRLPSSVDFFAVALEDPHPEVRKQALDGLVILASPESRRVLELAKSRVVGDDAPFRPWIEEAIDQIDQQMNMGL